MIHSQRTRKEYKCIWRWCCNFSNAYLSGEVLFPILILFFFLSGSGSFLLSHTQVVNAKKYLWDTLLSSPHCRCPKKCEEPSEELELQLHVCVSQRLIHLNAWMPNWAGSCELLALALRNFNLANANASRRISDQHLCISVAQSLSIWIRICICIWPLLLLKYAELCFRHLFTVYIVP